LRRNQTQAILIKVEKNKPDAVTPAVSKPEEATSRLQKQSQRLQARN
jgi:hypothetical protein